MCVLLQTYATVNFITYNSIIYVPCSSVHGIYCHSLSISSIIVSSVQGLEHAFLDAANKGDVPRMKDLLDQGCPVDAQNKVSTAVVSFHCM